MAMVGRQTVIPRLIINNLENKKQQFLAVLDLKHRMQLFYNTITGHPENRKLKNMNNSQNINKPLTYVIVIY